jgi:hypothetical protein
VEFTYILHDWIKLPGYAAVDNNPLRDIYPTNSELTIAAYPCRFIVLFLVYERFYLLYTFIHRFFVVWPDLKEV